LKETKEEIFGTRNSILHSYLKSENIDYLKDVWIVTARRSINSNPKTRYMVFVENTDKINLSMFKDFIKVYLLDTKNEEYSIKSARDADSEYKRFSKEEFRDFIVTNTKGEYIKSYAKGSSQSTCFSSFFRENMGKGYSLTDIDYLIPSSRLAIEEKNFNDKDKGYIGEGQFYSFKELKKDVFDKINLKIVNILSDKDTCHVKDFDEKKIINLVNKPKWGKMHEFEIKDDNIMSISSFLLKIKSNKINQYSMDDMLSIEELGINFIEEYFNNNSVSYSNVTKSYKYQRMDVDFVVNSDNDKKDCYVEVKADNYLTGNAVLEIVSNDQKKTDGWLLYSKANILAYYYTKNNTCYFIKMDKVKKFYLKNKDDRRFFSEIKSTSTASDNGEKIFYKTLFVLSNIEKLISEIGGKKVVLNKDGTYRKKIYKH